MNKLFFAVFVVAIGVSYGLFLDNLPGFCKEEKDCGAHKCCAFGNICAPKLGANFPCDGRLGAFHKCGCDDGLECKLIKVIKITLLEKTKTIKIQQCRAAEEVVIPKEIVYNEDAPRQKRFINQIGNAISGAVDTVVRKCSQQSDCGNKRCCAQLPIFGQRCILPYPIGTLCLKNGHCCGEGLECRSVFDVTTGEENGPTKKPVDIKLCLPASDPEIPPIEVDEK